VVVRCCVGISIIVVISPYYRRSSRYRHIPNLQCQQEDALSSLAACGDILRNHRFAVTPSSCMCRTWHGVCTPSLSLRSARCPAQHVHPSLQYHVDSQGKSLRFVPLRFPSKPIPYQLDVLQSRPHPSAASILVYFTCRIVRRRSFASRRLSRTSIWEIRLRRRHLGFWDDDGGSA